MPLVTPVSTRRPDATILVDAKVETKNYNAGIKRISKSSSDTMLKLLRGLSGVATFVRGLARVIGAVVKLVSLLTVGFFFLILAIQRFSSRLFSALERGIDKSSAYFSLLEQLRVQFDKLRGAAFSVFATALQAALPYIIKAVEWLTVMLEKLNNILAAMLGQKTVMRAIVKSAQDRQKAEEGSLAAFDQLNVLQKKDEQDTSDISFEVVPVTQEALDFVETLKDKIDEVKDNAVELWEAVVDSKPVQQTKTFLKQEWEDIKKAWARTVEFVNSEWEWIRTTATKVWTAIKDFGRETWEFIKADFANLGQFFSDLWEGIKATAIALWEGLKLSAEIAWEWVKSAWKDTKQFFSDLWDGIKDGFSKALETMQSKWESMFNGIKTFTKTVVNTIIGFVNGLIKGVIGGINSAISALNSINVQIPDWIPGIGGSSFGLNIPSVSAPQIPYLAQGAVIPPNAQFLAMLGDQTSGRNLEAPESLIRQIIQEEMSSGQISVNVSALLDGEVIYRNQQRVSMRHGTSLISNGVTS